MKKAFESWHYRLGLLFFALMNTVYAFAQEDGGGASVSVSKTTSSSSSSSGMDSTWYTNPWVWVIGGALFVLLLIALLRGNSSSSHTVVERDRTTDAGTVHRTTVTRTDVSGTADA